jgi:Fe-Mn family superoxide dismutase
VEPTPVPGIAAKSGSFMHFHQTKEGTAMQYAAQDYSKLIGMQGFSETLLKNHFTLYQGYVTNTNKVLESLHQMLKDNKTATPEYAELKRRFGWEFNGMRLHELYFENLGTRPQQINKSNKLALKMTEEFGSYENWEKDFKATGSMRGIGWCVLYQDTADSRLVNCWINEHDVSHLAGCNPVLIMDCFEHAYLTDYQLKRADYIAAFMKNIHWSVAESRFERFLQAFKKAA